MEYTIISGSDSDEVSRGVNEKLEEGWELHGDLKVISGTPNAYAQAMVKREYYGGTDYSALVTIDELDGIKYALKEIAEAIESTTVAMGYVARGLSGGLSEATQPQTALPANEPHSAKKASRKKR